MAESAVSTHTPALQISKEGKLIAANQAGKAFFKNNESGDFVQSALNFAFTGGISGEFEFVSRGETWLFSFELIGSGVVSLLGMNITSRINKWQETQQEYELFLSILSHQQSGILIESSEKKIAFINHALCNMFSLQTEPEVLTGTGMEKVEKNIFQYFENPSAFRQLMLECRQNKSPLFNQKFKTADNKIYKFDFIPFTRGSTLSFMAWQFQDISALIRANEIFETAENQFRTCISQLNMGLLEVDLKGCVMFANESFCKLTGYEENELVGQSATELLLTENSVKIMQQIQESRSHGHRHTYELELKCKNGESRVFLISGVPKLDISGNICGSIGIHVAISDPSNMNVHVGDHYRDISQVENPYHILNVNKLSEIKQLTVQAMEKAELSLLEEDALVLKSYIRNLQQSLRAAYNVISR